MLIFYPLVLLWDTIDGLYHVDFTGFNILDWLFRAPVIIFRVVGLVAALALINVLMYLHETISGCLEWGVGKARVGVSMLGRLRVGVQEERDRDIVDEASLLLDSVV